MEVLMVEVPQDYEDAFRQAAEKLNYKVTHVDSVFDAIAAMIRNNYDAVILNTTIQKKRWQEFKKHVDENNKQIIVAAYYDPEIITDEMLLESHFDLLFKCKNDVELHLKRLNVFSQRRKDLLCSTSQGHNVELAIKDGMIFNQENSIVSTGSGNIQLTDSEARIVSVLCRNRGKTVCRQTLYEAIYPGDKEIGKRRNIDVHIRNLREKIGSRSIRTVRGEGYLIE